MIKAFLFLVLAAYVLVALTYSGYLIWTQRDGQNLEIMIPNAIERGLTWPVEALSD